MNKNILAVAIIVAVALIAIVTLNGNTQNTPINESTMSDSAMIKKDSVYAEKVTSNESMMKVDTTTMKYDGVHLAGNTTKLLDFNKADYGAALNSDKFIVLYFYANWCPICKAEFPLMQTAFNELNRTDVIGFRVNFNDDQTDEFEKSLASQFGVPYQHTKVIIKGNTRLLKAPESWTKEDYLKNINALKQ